MREYSDLNIYEQNKKWIGYLYWRDDEGKRHQTKKTAKSAKKSDAKKRIAHVGA